jgi:hypothetical protein
MLHTGLRREAAAQGWFPFWIALRANRFNSPCLRLVFSKLLVGFVYGGTILIEIEIEIHFHLETF